METNNIDIHAHTHARTHARTHTHSDSHAHTTHAQTQASTPFIKVVSQCFDVLQRVRGLHPYERHATQALTRTEVLELFMKGQLLKYSIGTEIEVSNVHADDNLKKIESSP